MVHLLLALRLLSRPCKLTLRHVLRWWTLPTRLPAMPLQRQRIPVLLRARTQFTAAVTCSCALVLQEQAAFALTATLQHVRRSPLSWSLVWRPPTSKSSRMPTTVLR